MTNELIREMQKGDRNVIFECLSCNGAIFRMNAIGNTAIFGMNDDKTINRLIELKNDKIFLDGYTVGDFAIVALDILGYEKYQGNNSRIDALIETKFDFLR